jgi:uncharacterized protein HemY
MGPSFSKYLMIAGALIFLAGIIWYFWGNKLQWIGHLPGDIRIEKDNFRFYFPITTMIIFSIVLSALVAVIRRIL